MSQLKAEYGDDLQIRFRHNPLSFHNRAMKAAQASMAAHKQGRFWDYHDTLFANQKALEDDNLIDYATQLGLDVEQFKKDLNDEAAKERIEYDQTAAVNMGAGGTPAFFINGRYDLGDGKKMSGAKPIEEFKAVIDEEIRKVDAAIAAGVPADNAAWAVYAANNKQAFDLFVRNLPVSKPPPPPPEVWNVPVRGDEPTKGAKDPVITIVEWSDFQ